MYVKSAIKTSGLKGSFTYGPWFVHLVGAPQRWSERWNPGEEPSCGAHGLLDKGHMYGKGGASQSHKSSPYVLFAFRPLCSYRSNHTTCSSPQSFPVFSPKNTTKDGFRRCDFSLEETIIGRQNKTKRGAKWEYPNRQPPITRRQWYKSYNHLGLSPYSSSSYKQSRTYTKTWVDQYLLKEQPFVLSNSHTSRLNLRRMAERLE